MSQYVNFKDSTIFEFGCGWGSFLDFDFECKEYIGYDINKNLVDIAEKKYPTKNSVKTIANIVHFNFPLFKIICCLVFYQQPKKDLFSLI